MKYANLLLTTALTLGGQDVRLPAYNQALIGSATHQVNEFVNAFNEWALAHNDLLYSKSDVKRWKHACAEFHSAERQMREVGY